MLPSDKVCGHYEGPEADHFARRDWPHGVADDGSSNCATCGWGETDHRIALLERSLELTTEWLAFSHIQQATCLMTSRESLERFLKWKETGDDKEAWS